MLRRSTIAVMLAAHCHLAVADPVITGVSGNAVHGQTLTITGTGFGTKSPAKPYAYGDFEGPTSQPNAALSQVSSWTLLSNLSAASGIGIRGTAALQSYVFVGQEQNFGALLGFYGLPLNSYGERWYIFRKGRRNFAVTGAYNWKNLRFWYASGSLYTQIGNGNISEEAIPNAGYMCAWQGPLSSVCTDSITEAQTRAEPYGSWFTEQYIGTPGTGANNGFFRYIVNGRLAVEIPYTDYAPKYFAMAQGTPREMYIIHDESANDPDPPSGSQTFWDDVYFDRTWSRVMLSNRSTWGTASNGPLYEIQIPTAWSTTSVTVQVNRGELTAGTVYLYVVDSNNVANATGYPVTLAGSGGGDTTPPTVTMTAPSAGATVSDSSVTVSANASDNVGVVGVQFKRDTSTNIGSEDQSPPYSIAWDSTSTTDGAHTLTATARDFRDNRTRP